MTAFLSIAALWMGMALVSSLVASWLKVATAVVEILVGVAAAAIASELGGRDLLGMNEPWLVYISSLGALLLAFLAGAELEPTILKRSWKEVLTVGLVSFAAPFLGCTLIAYTLLGWSWPESLLAGVALSSVSMVVVYSLTLEYGFNKIDFGKSMLGACFLTNLGTVLALGFIFSPFTLHSLIFLSACVVVLPLSPLLTRLLLSRVRGRTAEIETKWILVVLFGLGTLAAWSGGEPVLVSYLTGLAMASTIGRNQVYRARLQTLTMGLLTPFFFIRAGSLLSLPALLGAPLAILILFGGRMLFKLGALVPVIGRFRNNLRERWYFALLMSTGLTFSSIAALFGLEHGIINQDQYSVLVTVVIASAILPTLVANGFFLPFHLLRFRDDRSSLPKTPIHRDTGRWYT
jgi:glutathione-regulated potassium-efflux system ancillary protein KefC